MHQKRSLSMHRKLLFIVSRAFLARACGETWTRGGGRLLTKKSKINMCGVSEEKAIESKMKCIVHANRKVSFSVAR